MKNKCPDYVVEIREKMRELMNTVVRRSCRDKHTDKVLYTDPPEAGLPYEFYECLEELCEVCNEYKLPNGHLWKEVKRGSPIRCQTRSLCAAALWEKIKSLYPMSMAESSQNSHSYSNGFVKSHCGLLHMNCYKVFVKDIDTLKFRFLR